MDRRFLYCGPCIRVEIKEILERWVTCPNEECSNHGQTLSGNFCPQCGKRLPQRKIGVLQPSLSAPPPVGLIHLPDEAIRTFTQQTMHADYFLPHGLMQYGLLEEIDSGDVINDTISSSKISKQLEKFRKCFAAQIKQIKEKFGADNTSVLWIVTTFEQS